MYRADLLVLEGYQTSLTFILKSLGERTVLLGLDGAVLNLLTKTLNMGKNKTYSEAKMKGAATSHPSSCNRFTTYHFTIGNHGFNWKMTVITDRQNVIDFHEIARSLTSNIHSSDQPTKQKMPHLSPSTFDNIRLDQQKIWLCQVAPLYLSICLNYFQ